MNRKNQNKRREFLNNVCPTVAMAFLGVSLLESCSSGGDDSDINGGGNNGGGNNGGGSDNGYTKNGNDVTINLNHSNFSKLKNDGWQNFYQEKILLLKISSSSYRAFTGTCPHQGVHTACLTMDPQVNLFVVSMVIAIKLIVKLLELEEY
jgi:hypothetical protein